MGRNSNTVVACYTLSGELVKTYPSAVIASRSRNLFKRTIDRCIRGDIKVVKNLQWKRYPANEVPIRIDPVVNEKKILTIKPVARLNESNEIDKIYPSINKAAKDNNIDTHSLRDLLNKKYPYLGKTKFRYLTDNEISKYNLKKGREINNKTKPVIQYDLNGNYIKTYPSIREATISLGKNVNNRGISQCLTGKYQTAFGYIWKYKTSSFYKQKGS